MSAPILSAARRFEEQVVVVTGAGGGIGSAIAARFAFEGAHVVVCDAMETAAAAAAASIAADGGSASVLAFDLTDRTACAAAIEQVVATHGRVDVLVNNAGVNRRGDLLSLTDADWPSSTSGRAAASS